MKRADTLMDVYTETSSQCYFDMDGKEHPMYYETGFKALEYDVYRENDILDDLENKIPNYKSSDLKKNYYQLYQKPYSFWSDYC